MANRRFIDFPIASTVGDSDIILIWQSGANKQTTKATFLSGLPENLEDLNDVVISGLTNGQILRYDSVTGKWENTDQGNLDLNDLNDVSIVSPSNGQVLVYNSSTSKWENSSGGYVPYVGAVTTVDLGAQGLRAGYVRFDTTVASVPNEQGLMFWDADDETVDIILNGYTMKIGEDLFYPVKNQTGSTIAKGVAVRFNGTVGASGRLLIAPFIADGSVPSSRFMGVTAEEILNGEDGKVLYFGRVRGINTNAFNEGDILYASTTVAGGYQTAIPVAPNNIVQVAAVVTKSATVGTIFVRPTLGSNINKDEGVKIVSVADKNLLQYQSGTSLWENKSLAQVLGGTSAQFVKGDGSLDSISYGTGTVTSVGLSSATSGVTIGSTPVTTSGTITLAIATASGSQNGLLSSTDWTTFNNKQNALTNPVTGTGTTNYLPKFTGSTTIGNSNLINDASGNLGLGVTPSAWSLGTALDVANGPAILGFVNETYLINNAYFNSGFKYKQTSFASMYVQNSTGEHRFFTATSGTAGNAISFTQAMTLFSDGNLLVGSPSPITNNGARLQVSGTARITGDVTIAKDNPKLILNDNAGGSQNNYSISSNFGFFNLNDETASGVSVMSYGGGLFNFTGAATFSSSVTANNYVASGGSNTTVFNSTGATTGWVQIAMNNTSGSALLGIEGTTAGTLATGSIAYASVLRNYTDTAFQIATNNIVRATITSGGEVLVGTTTTDVNTQGCQLRSFGLGIFVRSGASTLQLNRLSSDGIIASFRTSDIERGSISISGSTTSYNTTSDYRLKEDFKEIKGLEKIKAIKVYDYKWKSYNKRMDGVLAHELAEVLPYAVFGEKDELDEYGNCKMQSVDYSKIVPIMIKSIQELKQEIDTLKN